MPSIKPGPGDRAVSEIDQGPFGVYGQMLENTNNDNHKTENTKAIGQGILGAALDWEVETAALRRRNSDWAQKSKKGLIMCGLRVGLERGSCG